MKIVVSSDGNSLDAAMSALFGRCRNFVFVETDTMEWEAVANPAVGAAGGAGIRAAQFVADHGAQAVVTGNVGPNAYSTLAAANVPVYVAPAGTVREAAQALAEGKLESADNANVASHTGTGGRGRGMGRGRA